MALSANHGILGSTGKGLAYAVGADNADHRACKNGYKDRRVGRKS